MTFYAPVRQVAVRTSKLVLQSAQKPQKKKEEAEAVRVLKLEYFVVFLPLNSLRRSRWSPDAPLPAGFSVVVEELNTDLRGRACGCSSVLLLVLDSEAHQTLTGTRQDSAGLDQYPVVESFFLDSTTENYLELEFCPHGQHLVLLLSGVGQAFIQQLPMVFSATIRGDAWVGEALVPWSYFPPNVNKMNSYAIHGSGEKRTYEALYPVPREDLVEGQQPNFHRLQYFKDFRLQSIMGEDWVQPPSDLWVGKP